MKSPTIILTKFIQIIHSTHFTPNLPIYLQQNLQFFMKRLQKFNFQNACHNKKQLGNEVRIFLYLRWRDNPCVNKDMEILSLRGCTPVRWWTGSILRWALWLTRLLLIYIVLRTWWQVDSWSHSYYDYQRVNMKAALKSNNFLKDNNCLSDTEKVMQIR